MVLGIALTLVLIPVAIFAYAFVVYPAILVVVASVRKRSPPPAEPTDWPSLTIILPVYNEERSVAGTIEALLATDYPADRRHILVLSDASTDQTDTIVQRYQDRGVELLRLPIRSGKTAAENASASRLRGTIVVSTDATTFIPPGSLKPLVNALGDPTVGVASGRDVSRSAALVTEDTNAGESGYVGFEMWLRRLETRVGSIVGASGCFYAVRRELHELLVPSALSRDFACTLLARRKRLRSVSVDDAVCYVPRTRSLQAEFRRKSRTMARGLETLGYLRELMNPFRYGSFAWMLFSHKLARWLVFGTAPLIPLGLVLMMLTPAWPIGLTGLVLVAASAALAFGAYHNPDLSWPGPVARICYLMLALVAGAYAWIRALRGELNPIWEPTRR